ncbi:MAG: hypothetical protein LBB88_11950 [Planctomycetaceae bacterium]|nr:hypothetical protein [Planctomycetaceae bacterium]
MNFTTSIDGYLKKKIGELQTLNDIQKAFDENGCVNVLGNHFKIDKLWMHRLIRVEINLIKHIIDFYRLRKREPNDQPRIKTKKFTLQ